MPVGPVDMIISKTTGYGIRALAYLAARSGETPCPLQEIVEHEQIPKIFLQKILGSLRRRRMLRSARGIHGGYELGRPADTISLWDVYCLLEPDPYLDGCILGCTGCQREAECGLHAGWGRLRGELVTILQTTTIASLAGDRAGNLAPRPEPPQGASDPVTNSNAPNNGLIPQPSGTSHMPEYRP